MTTIYDTIDSLAKIHAALQAEHESAKKAENNGRKKDEFRKLIDCGRAVGLDYAMMKIEEEIRKLQIESWKVAAE